MKFVSTFIVLVVLAITNVTQADDDSLSGILLPILALLQPLLCGLNRGLQRGAVEIGSGVHQVGSALNSVTSGVGTIVANTAVGLGGTVKSLPSGLYKTTRNLQKNTGLVGSTLDTLTGPVTH